MKIYRIIGTVIGALLTPIFIILLCAALLLSGVAGLVTQKSIDAIVQNVMENEEIKSSVSEMITDTLLPGATLSGTQMKETVDQLMALPSVQQIVSNIVSNSADEITSGNFDGDLDLTEQLQTTITEDPELLSSLSEDVVNVLLENDDFRTMMVQSLVSDANAMPIGEDVMDEILKETAVKNLLAKVVSVTIEDRLGVGQSEPVDVASEASNIIASNPTFAQTISAIAFPDSESFDAAIAQASDFAAQNGMSAPAEDLSQVEFLQYCLDLYRDNINDAVRNAILDVDTDKAAYAPEVAYDHDPSGQMNIQFDEESVEMINELAAALTVFKHPLFIVGILVFFLFTYLLTALLTWSFRYPLIFSGITAILTGLLLLLFGAIPFSDILNAAAEGSAASPALVLVASIWASLSDKLILNGTIAIVLGILLITVFIITGILLKGKKQNVKEAHA